MNLKNRTILYLLLFSGIAGKQLTEKVSNKITSNESKPICGTPFIVNSFQYDTSSISTFDLSGLKDKESLSQNKLIQLRETNLDLSYETEHFRINYTFEGINAVESIDYILSMGNIFEQVYSFFIDTLDYDKPPTNSDGFYDINVERLEPGYFGYAIPQGYGKSCIGNIAMRNSYSSSDFNTHTEEENIKVTAVHEFFHLVQFGYNCYSLRQGSGDIWFMEATAVWSEDALYNGINDHYRYMGSWFSSPTKSIYDQGNSYMYGTFIFFQYIDEHLGGPETIRTCWENSRNLASPIKDVSLESINNALASYNSSFENAYSNMRIANRILTDSEGAGIYRYEEATGYLSATTTPREIDLRYFNAGDLLIINDNPISKQLGHYQKLGHYQSLYYSISTDAPMSIFFNDITGNFRFSTIIKYEQNEQWIVRSEYEQNIDPEIDIEWISILISTVGENGNEWDFSLEFSDGYSEDFSSFSPYPNPSFGKNISMDIQVISKQTIHTTIYNLLGQQIWKVTKQFDHPDRVTLSWNGLNSDGSQISNGYYFIVVEGKYKKENHKIIYLKN